MLVEGHFMFLFIERFSYNSDLANTICVPHVVAHLTIAHNGA